MFIIVRVWDEVQFQAGGSTQRLIVCMRVCLFVMQFLRQEVFCADVDAILCYFGK